MPMDEIQTAFYRLQFRLAFLEKKGTEFHDWFAERRHQDRGHARVEGRIRLSGASQSAPRSISDQ